MSYDPILSVFAHRVDRLIADGHETVGRMTGVVLITGPDIVSSPMI